MTRPSTDIKRPYRTDYAGAWCGNCSTRESAIRAAIAHVLTDGYTAATIIDRRTGTAVARVRVDDNRRGFSVHMTGRLVKVPR